MHRRLSFTRWLKRQNKRDDSVGDLARDVRQDPTWPRARTLKGFERYLADREACTGAIQALKSAWHEWSELSVRPVASVVREFAAQMEAKLRANDHKRNWRLCSLRYLRARLSEELAELDEALADGDPYLVLDEAVDVANFAMMIADVTMQVRKGHEKG